MHGLASNSHDAFIARDSPDRARAFGHLLVDTALFLEAQPERGRVVPEQDDPAVREIIREPYRIIYEVVRDPSAVFVLRFWHGARGTPDVPKVSSGRRVEVASPAPTPPGVRVRTGRFQSD